MDTMTLNVAQLEERKTRLVTELALGTMPQARVGAQIELIDELIKELTPVPPEQGYFVLYHVTWRPTIDDPDGDAPLDQAHRLTCTDDRITDYEMVEIGSAEAIDRIIRNVV